MCGKGGGSPPVPSAASTTFNSTTSPSPDVAPLYKDFVNRASTLSQTPFNPAMLGSVAPLNAEQTAAGGQLFDLGMHMGDFDPARVTSLMSPFTENVVKTTQDWFNNQNAIQGNDLISQAIRTGNAFGGDRAGVAEGVLAGQQQLAQAPVIAGLRERGYSQALDEYNRLKQFGMAGAQAAMGWGSIEQQQAQREKDVAQQNAMMESAYPFQTMNWYGSALGGIGPLMGQTAAGSNNPPSPNATGQIVGAASAGLGLLGAITPSGGGTPTGASSTSLPGGGARGGSVDGMARGGLVDDDDGGFGGRDPRTQLAGDIIYLPITPGPQAGRPTMLESMRGFQTLPFIGPRLNTPGYDRATSADRLYERAVRPRGFAFGGDPSASAFDDSDSEDRDSLRDRSDRLASSKSEQQPDYSSQDTQGARKIARPDFGFGQLKLGARQLPQPVFPSSSGTTQPQQKSDTEQWLGLATKAVPLATSLFALSDRKTKTDVQRIGRDDDGEPLYGFRYRGDPKTYPKVVGPMARPMAWGGGVRRYANGGGDDDDQLTMTDLGVLSPGGRELPSSIAGPGRGSPAGGLPQQADVMPNLARVRERFRPVLENDPELRRKFDINTTAEVGERPEARNFYQALTLDRAAARGEALPYTLSRGPGTPDKFYPRETMNATRAAGIGVSPSLWLGANPANYGTGNASYDPRTGRHVGFAGGPQTGSVQTSSGTERSGVEGPDLPAVRRWGYAGPSRTAIGPGGPQGTAAQVDAEAGERTAASTEAPAAGPRGQGQQGQGQRPGRSGEVANIPGLEKPAPTFGQRWASNPFTQFGAAMLAGKSPHLGVNLGNAMMSAAELQNKSRREDILDAKPEHIVLPNGEQGFRIGGKIFNLGLGVPTSESRAAEEHQRKMLKPDVEESDDIYGKTKTYFDYVRGPDGVLRRVPRAAPETPQQAPQPETPKIAPPAAPATPPAAQPPPTTAPQVRQTEAPAWQPGATTDPRITGTPIKTEAPVLPPSMTAGTTEPAQQGQAGAAGPAGAAPPAPRPDADAVATDEQKDTAAQVQRKGGFRTPLNPKVAPPRMLEFFNTTPEGFDFRAAQLALGDTSVLQNLGNSKAAGAYKSALRERAAQYWMDRGLGPDRAMAAVAEFGAQKAGARSLATQEARITGALKTAMQTAPRVVEASQNVDRTRFPDLNKVILAAKQKTGDPSVVQFGLAIETFVNNYARAMGGGNNVLTDNAREQAHLFLQANYSKGQINAGIDQALVEMDSELTGIRSSMPGYLGTEPEVRYQRGDVFKGRVGQPGQQAPQGAPQPQIPTLTSKEQYDKLAPGTQFRGKDGNLYVK